MGRVTGSYDYNATCDVCGFKYKASEMKKRWDGLMVCRDDYETRHPSDFYKVKNDTHVLPFTRQDQVDYQKDYQGIFDNYDFTTSIGGLSSNNWGHSFNTLTSGTIEGFKFYVDRTTLGYNATVDNNQNFRIALYRLHDASAGGAVEEAPTLVGFYSFQPPFHNGWNYRSIPGGIPLERLRTYLITRVWENSNATGVTPNNGSLHYFEDNPYLQWGAQVYSASEVHNTLNDPPRSAATSVVPIDIRFIPTAGETPDTQSGVFTTNFGTQWDNNANGSTNTEVTDAVIWGMAISLGAPVYVSRVRVWGAANVESLRLTLWNATTGNVEWDSGTALHIIPNSWNYVEIDPTLYLDGITYIVAASAYSNFPTLANSTRTYVTGDAEPAHPILSYYGNYHRNVYGNPGDGTLEATNLPYLIDIVAGEGVGGMGGV